jgi:hypothetical protein
VTVHLLYVNHTVSHMAQEDQGQRLVKHKQVKTRCVLQALRKLAFAIQSVADSNTRSTFTTVVAGRPMLISARHPTRQVF